MDLQNFHHDQAPKTGVLLVNLGTPEAPDRASVRRYLKEFLWDKRVVELSRPAWWLVLNLFILNTRPAHSARAYRKIWTPEGSPLMVISRAQETALRQSLQQQFGDLVSIELAMRYGSPSIPQSLDKLREQGVRQLLVLPLYPQYSASTTASIFDAVTRHLQQWRWLPELRFINHYHDEPAYITALAESVTTHRQQHGNADQLLMSFHGIPQDYFHKGDPYHCECQTTARLLAESLGLPKDRWGISFQSRLGPKQWLQPYTDHTLRELAKSGVKSVQVICPGFSADCLETLEEIAMENRDIFMQAGGERYEYIPCLNDTSAHIDMLTGLIKRHISGWSMDDEEPEAILERARQLGAQQ
jgi:ferrochelatase